MCVSILVQHALQLHLLTGLWRSGMRIMWVQNLLHAMLLFTYTCSYCGWNRMGSVAFSSVMQSVLAWRGLLWNQPYMQLWADLKACPFWPPFFFVSQAILWGVLRGMEEWLSPLIFIPMTRISSVLVMPKMRSVIGTSTTASVLTSFRWMPPVIKLVWMILDSEINIGG